MTTDNDVLAQGPPPLDKETMLRAMVLAMGVRNAMERLHGGGIENSLTDAQMAQINPLVRNAIATGLHAEKHYHHKRAARSYLDFQQMLIPEYWEPAELLDSYVKLFEMRLGDDGYQKECRMCGQAIVDVGQPSAPAWKHLGADGRLYVGCRAASFQPDSGWNDRLDKSWKAAPRADPR